MSADLPAIKRGLRLRVILDKPLDVPKQTPREESKEKEAGLAIYVMGEEERTFKVPAGTFAVRTTTSLHQA